MKIRAIRVAEVGCFSTPVALEGLSGQLDVLSGPNELGKSTLLKALQTVFAEKYNSKKSSLKSRLIPYHGGAPLIEVEFELEGEHWRLRKRFFTSAFAELRAANGQLSRNSDAEGELELLLSRHGGGARLGLFWVEQGSGLEPIGAGAAEGSLLKALEREVAAVANGSTLRKAHTELRKRLAELKTAKRDQATGAYKAAITEYDALQCDRAILQEAFSRAQSRLLALAEARTALMTLEDPAYIEAALERRLAAERAVIAADAAAQRLRELEHAWQRQDAAHALAQTLYQQLATQLAEHHSLSVERAGHLANFARVLEMQTALGRRVAETRAALAEAEATEHMLRVALLTAERAVRYRQEADRYARDRAALAQRLADARRYAARRSDLREAIADNPLDARLLARIEAETREIKALETEIAMRAPTLEVCLEKGAAGRIRLDGVPVAADLVRSLGSRTVLTIDGIGSISVTPADAKQTEEVLADLAAHHAVLADLLARAGVSDHAAATARYAERCESERALTQVSAQLAAAAPEGLPALEVEWAALEAEADRFGCEPDRAEGLVEDPGEVLTCDPIVLAERLEAAIAVRAAAAAAAEAAVDGERNGHAEFARCAARTDEIARRLAALDEILPPPAERQARLDHLAEAAAQAQISAREALLLKDALLQTTPSDQMRQDLAAELTAAEAAVAADTERRHALAREIAGLEAALERDAADGIEERLAVLQERITAAAARLDALSREVAALSLLDRLFEASEREVQDRYVIPAAAAVGPYLTTVFPAADLGIGKGLEPESLKRGGKVEPVAALSDGTKEQIAILARLGFAAIEARAGRPIPVILDDALVYADDARIARMFESLQTAARLHQVIMLTCRERAFAGIGGNRLRLAPWHGGV